MRYWVNTVSLEDVQHGVAAQEARLKRIAKGDRVVFYSPRQKFREGAVVRQFTAIGEVADDAPHQREEGWRRRVSFQPVIAAAIEPLIESLGFIRDKKQWGFVFRRGLFEIAEADFATIAAAMSLSEESFPLAAAR